MGLFARSAPGAEQSPVAPSHGHGHTNLSATSAPGMQQAGVFNGELHGERRQPLRNLVNGHRAQTHEMTVQLPNGTDPSSVSIRGGAGMRVFYADTQTGPQLFMSVEVRPGERVRYHGHVGQPGVTTGDPGGHAPARIPTAARTADGPGAPHAPGTVHRGELRADGHRTFGERLRGETGPIHTLHVPLPHDFVPGSATVRGGMNPRVLTVQSPEGDRQVLAVQLPAGGRASYEYRTAPQLAPPLVSEGPILITPLPVTGLPRATPIQPIQPLHTDSGPILIPPHAASGTPQAVPVQPAPVSEGPILSPPTTGSTPIRLEPPRILPLEPAAPEQFPPVINTTGQPITPVGEGPILPPPPGQSVELTRTQMTQVLRALEFRDGTNPEHFSCTTDPLSPAGAPPRFTVYMGTNPATRVLVGHVTDPLGTPRPDSSLPTLYGTTCSMVNVPAERGVHLVRVQWDNGTTFVADGPMTGPQVQGHLIEIRNGAPVSTRATFHDPNNGRVRISVHDGRELTLDL